MTDTERDRLLAGAAAYNVAAFRVAAAVWRDGEGPQFAGLAALAEAVAAGRAGEWDQATAAAERARELLGGIENGSVTLLPLHRWLATFLTDPESVERGRPPAVVVDGERRLPETLPLTSAGLAAAALAERSSHDAAVVADAIRFAEREDHPDESRYATFLRDFVGNPERRPIVFERLAGLVERERRKERDVDGLFDGEGE